MRRLSLAATDVPSRDGVSCFVYASGIRLSLAVGFLEMLKVVLRGLVCLTVLAAACSGDESKMLVPALTDGSGGGTTGASGGSVAAPSTTGGTAGGELGTVTGGDASGLPGASTDAGSGGRPDASGGDIGDAAVVDAAVVESDAAVVDASVSDAGIFDAAVAEPDSALVDAGGALAPGFVFSPYKAASIHLNWNTHVLSTKLSGELSPLAVHMTQQGVSAVELGFASGECGNETWAGGIAGDVMAAANVGPLAEANIHYMVSTGGAGAGFTCASDADFATFVDRWRSPLLAGIDFDIEHGQTPEQILALMQRVAAAHVVYPALRFSLTLATSAKNEGAETAVSLGTAAKNNLNATGQSTLDAVRSALGFTGEAATWPSYLTVNLMTMNYGSPRPDRCVVSDGRCQMGQSAIQAAFNLHDVWGVPYANIELTPMIGANGVVGENFTLADVDLIMDFARAYQLAGIHYWSYDRDTDCAEGASSPKCNSMGDGYAGVAGYLARFLEGMN